jgi:hypothetical protein
MKILYTFALIITLSLIACQKKPEPQKHNNVVDSSIVTEKFCFLKDIKNEGGINYATIDFIDYVKTSDIDSSILTNQIIELPNGYSYVNTEIINEKLEIADSVKIILQTFSFNEDGNFNFNQQVTLKKLEEALQKKGDKIFLHSPFKIELENNKIISLTEIYIP